MAIQVVPASAGGGIKLVQRGQAVSAGNISITPVDTTKTFVQSFSEGSSGTVASNSIETGGLGPSGGSIAVNGGGSSGNRSTASSFASYSGTRSFSSGTMNLTAKEMGVYLTNSSTLTATGACRWEIVEYL